MNDSHLRLMARDYKFFDAARRVADTSTFKVHVGAVAVWRGRIVCSAASSCKTDPLQQEYNKYRISHQIDWCLPKAHAEIILIKKLLKMDIPMREVKVYVYRTCKSREKGLARPCKACIEALRDANIRGVYYTTDDGFCYEWIDNRSSRGA